MSEDIDLEEFAPWLAGLITLVGLLLRVLLLGTKGMWLDETFNVVAGQPQRWRDAAVDRQDRPTPTTLLSVPPLLDRA